MTIEAQTSSRRRRNTSKAAEKASEVGDEDESERSDVSRKSIKGNKPGRSLSLRPRKSKYLQNPITCIIGGISVVFTAYFTWTTMKTLSKKERPTPTVFFHPPDVKTTRILENKRTEDPNPMDGHAIRTTTLRGSRDDDQAIEKVMKVHSPRPIHKPIHHYSKTSWTAREPDYGGLRISLPIASGIPRKIREYYYEPNTSPDHGDDDDTGHESPSYDEYYAFDDDILRATDGVAAKPFQDPSCRRVQEHRYSFPNCNDFHQLDPADAANNEFQFINKGGFREVFSIRTPQDIFAIKEILFEKINVSRYFELMEYVRMDAIVAERLSASPRIYDIYGYCALSIASEFFFHGDIEALSGGEIAYHPPVKNDDAETSRDDDDAWRPKNVFTPAQKLVLGLDMAEGLADLHGYDGGVIIHDDVQLSQYLLNKDKTRLKLNDFNRAEFALWNGTDYCRHQNGHGKGMFLDCVLFAFG